MAKGALPTISVHVVRAAFAEAIARGLPPTELCTRFGVAPEQLADEEWRIEVDVMRRLWTELPAALGAADFGLDVARRAGESGPLHLLGYLARSAATLGQSVGTRRPHRASREAEAGFRNAWSGLLQDTD